MRPLRELVCCGTVMLVVSVLTSAATAATFEAFVSSSGTVSAEATPLGCVRLGTVAITLTNNDDVDELTNLTVALPAGLTAIAGSCQATLGSCM